MIKNKILFLFFLLVLWTVSTDAQDSLFVEKLKALPNVVSVNEIKGHEKFKGVYEIMIQQKLNYSNLEDGTFLHRVILGNYNLYSPVVMVTEGYNGDYATRPSYINELTEIVEANQIVVEHRYFSKSLPENPNWDYLTLENSMNDLHEIYELFKTIYPESKWLATGISKGGQTTLTYKTLFPNDMDIWVPYVAPLNFKLEEKRHEKFISKTGTAQVRAKIFDFQNKILDERDTIQVLLDSLIDANHFTYNIPEEEILDYCVLEYPFAFWQWGIDAQTIPSDSADVQTLFKHLMKVSSCDYFSHQGIEPIKACFVMFSREMGYYAYNSKPFKGKLVIKNAKGYFNKMFLPEGVHYKYSNKISKKIKKTINKDGGHILLIYGETDPWFASAVVPSKKSEALKFVNPGMSHRARINNMPIELKSKIYMQLETWLSE